MSTSRRLWDLEANWVSLSFNESSPIRELYGFSGNQGKINLEGVLYRPRGKPSKSLLVFMHPASSCSHLLVPRALAQAGFHVLCAGNRYARNDTTCIMEKAIIDYGMYARYAKEVLGYEKLILSGWSGGGSLTSLYQSQAEHTTITDTPAGDPIELGKLVPGDAFIFHAAHLSRAEVLRDFIDPSIVEENDPDRRIVELDLYDPRNPNQPPYSHDYLEFFRKSQLARIRRRTAYAKELLERFRHTGAAEMERGLLTHRTLADPRFLDGSVDPNDREIGKCFLGIPGEANVSPAGVARFSVCRAWLSQWSIDDTRAHALEAAPHISVPSLVIENSADDAVPQPHPRRFFDALRSTDKTFAVLDKANHYYLDQPDKLEESLALISTWLTERRLVDG
jgi:pimeloyl-ACP methyl ester carboxylesterase